MYGIEEFASLYAGNSIEGIARCFTRLSIIDIPVITRI